MALCINKSDVIKKYCFRILLAFGSPILVTEIINNVGRATRDIIIKKIDDDVKVFGCILYFSSIATTDRRNIGNENTVLLT